MRDCKSIILPNVVLAGVRRCGTTSVYKWLSAHPQVGSSATKGTEFLMDRDSAFFNTLCNYHDHGLQAYSQFFAGQADHTVWLDATTRYFDQQTARTVLSQLHPQPHVLFMLRDPAERLQSLLQYERDNRRHLVPQATLRDFVRCVSEGRADKLLARDELGRPERDITKWRQELSEEYVHGRYVQYLAAWKALLSPARLHVYLFEDMKRDARTFMRRMAQDIDIDPDFYDRYEFAVHNPSVRLRSPAVHRLIRRLRKVIPKNWLTKLLHRTYLRLQDAKHSHLGGAESEELAEVREFYRSDNERLADEFGMDLSSWDSPEDTAPSNNAEERHLEVC